jgi:hypothetical protein
LDEPKKRLENVEGIDKSGLITALDTRFWPMQAQGRESRPESLLARDYLVNPGRARVERV